MTKPWVFSCLVGCSFTALGQVAKTSEPAPIRFDESPKEGDSLKFVVNQSSTLCKAETIFNTVSGTPINNLLGIGQDFDGSIERGTAQFPWKVRYRLVADLENLKTAEDKPETIVERLITQISTSIASTRITFGLQEVTWGDNLIMPVIDVVNPRNLTHPSGFYDSAAKIPQLMAVTETPVGTSKIEAIINLMPTPGTQPDEVFDFRIKQPKQKPLGIQHIEYGTKVTLVDDALETKIYAYRHGSRVPTYVFLPYSSGNSGAPDIEVVDNPSNTYGVSASYATFEWLLRSDLAWHNDHPATNIATKVETTQVTQGILGLSTITMTQQNFGAELHFERWEDQPVAYTTTPFLKPRRGSAEFYWLGLVTNLNFFNSQIQPNLVFFHGLNSKDLLIKFDTKANLSEQSTITVEVQRTNTKTSSPKLLLSKRDSLSLRYAYIF